MSLLLSALMSLPAPPIRMIEAQTAACEMSTPKGNRTSLTIAFRPEDHGGRPGYWWTIEGDDRLYPSNPQARNMYSSEIWHGEQSIVHFEAAGYHYVYSLRYQPGIRDRQEVFLPAGYLTVYRRPSGRDADAEPVGIGFCTLRPGKARQ